MPTAFLFLLLLLPTSRIPDILPPGHKSVRHELILVWDDETSIHRFVAYPTRGFHGHHEIKRDKPFRFSSKYGTRIYAMPLDAEFPTEREAAKAVDWPNTEVPVREVSSISASHPLARVESTLQIVAVTAEGIEFKLVGERRLAENGSEIGGFDYMLLVLIAGAGIVLLLVLNRRSRQAAPAVE